MEYISKIENIKNHHLIFKMPIKNQNSKYLYYYKLLYSDTTIHLKYLLFQLQFSTSQQHIYGSKVEKHDPMFEKIKALEELILLSINQSIQKQPKYCLHNEIINKDIFNINTQNNHQPLYLKISVIFEDNMNICLVYKLYYTNTCLQIGP